MVPPDIVERVRRYLSRQHEWLTQTLQKINALNVEQASEALPDFLENQSREMQQLQAFEREQALLLREWQAAQNHVPEHDKTTIRELARQTADLTRALQERYEETVKRVQQEQDQQQDMVIALRKGRDLINRYRPMETGQSDYMDKKA